MKKCLKSNEIWATILKKITFSRPKVHENYSLKIQLFWIQDFKRFSQKYSIKSKLGLCERSLKKSFKSSASVQDVLLKKNRQSLVWRSIQIHGDHLECLYLKKKNRFSSYRPQKKLKKSTGGSWKLFVKISKKIKKVREKVFS